MTSQWHIDDAVMCKRAHGSKAGAFLPATLRCGRDEETAVFAPIATTLPLFSRLVPESLPLCREVAITCRNAEEESIVFLEFVRRDKWDACVLARRIHFRKDVFGEGFFDSGER